MKTPYIVLFLWRTFLPLTQPVAAVNGVLEFGEFRLLKPAQKGMKAGPPFLLRKSEPLDDFLDGDAPFWDTGSSMSMGSAKPTTSPVTWPTPALVPTPLPAPSSSSRPTVPEPGSDAPSASGSPTPASPPTTSIAPAPTPLNSTLGPVASGPTSPPSVTAAPSVTPGPTASGGPTTPPCEGPCFEIVFKCSNKNVVVEAQPPGKSVIDFTVGYLVETSALLEDFIRELEALILETAVIGALKCGDGGPLFGPKGTPPQILMFTTATGEACPAQSDGSVQSQTTDAVCTVLETKFQIAVKEFVDPQLGAFLGYRDLQVAMDNGTFVETIPALNRVEYLTPLPLLPPITDPNNPSPAPIDSEESQLSVSRWTIGAVVAMCVGGTIAIGAWARNRRTRNQRHMQLLEETSSMATPAAPISPEQPRH